MILVQQTERYSTDITLVSNGESFNTTADFIAHLGAVGVGLAKRPTLNQPYGKKNEVVAALHETYQYQDGMRLFNPAIKHKAQKNLREAIEREIVSPLIAAEDLELLDKFKGGEHYVQLNYAGLVAVGGTFDVLAGPIEDSFSAGEREFDTANSLCLTHEAMQYRVTDCPVTGEIDEPLNQVHASLGILDKKGEYQPVVTVLNDWYVQNMTASLLRS